MACSEDTNYFPGYWKIIARDELPGAHLDRCVVRHEGGTSLVPPSCELDDIVSLPALTVRY